MQINSQQSLTLPEVPKRPGVINCASYAQGVRVANVVIADISEELKHEDRFVWVGLFEPDENCCAKSRKNSASTTWPLRMPMTRTNGQS